MVNYYCVIKNCPTSSRMNPNHVPFHQFPSDTIIKEKWIESIKSNCEMRTVKSNANGKSEVICGLHFSPDDYLVTKAGKLTRRLDSTVACPSIFPRKDDGDQDLRSPLVKRARVSSASIDGTIMSLFKFFPLRICIFG